MVWFGINIKKNRAMSIFRIIIPPNQENAYEWRSFNVLEEEKFIV